MDTILQDLSSPAVPLAMDAAMLAFWKLFQYLPQLKLHHEHGLSWFESDFSPAIFNRVIQAELTSETAPHAIETIINLFQQRLQPFHWHVGPSSTPHNLGALLLARGLTHDETEPIMAADLHHLNEETRHPAQLSIQPVTTTKELHQWEYVWESDEPEEKRNLWVNLYASLPPETGHRLQKHLGMLDGQPVATAEIFLGGGVAYLGGVSTLPRYRRQGIGGAITLAALGSARQQGYRIALLTASPMGAPVYHRLGFQERGLYSKYRWQTTQQGK